MRAIYRRELSAFRNNMTGGLAVAFLVASVGLYFFVYNLQTGYPSVAVALYAAVFMYLVAIPMLTMRSLSEERRSRTDQLLLTSPVSVTGVVLGKYLALLTVLAAPCALFCFCPLILSVAAGSGGTVYFLTDYASLFCFFLLGAAYLSVGLFLSSLTESQVIAGVGTFFVLLVLHMWSGLVSLLPTDAAGSLILLLIGAAALGLGLKALTGSLALGTGAFVLGAGASIACYAADSSLLTGLVPNALAKLSFTGVLETFAYDQSFDLAGVVLLLSVTGLMLFLTVQTVQRRRWY